MPLPLSIEEHLQWWGLQLYEVEDAYESWQRTALSSQTLQELNRLARCKTVSQTVPDEIAFYDYSVQSSILPVLYSQRYHYYQLISSFLVPWIPSSGTLLDFGCGPGIVTTYLARRFPDSSFTGIDRSPECIRVAQEQANQLHLKNVKFVCHDFDVFPEGLEPFDVVLSCQALLQSEHDPGIPSDTWKGYARSRIKEIQDAFERRTGLSPRLDYLSQQMKDSGKMLLYEKVGHLGRRVPFQRALTSRGLQLLHAIDGLSYRDMGNTVDDGPIYVVGKGGEAEKDSSTMPQWNESPTSHPDSELYTLRGVAARSFLARLPNKRIKGKVQEDNYSIQVEWGIGAGLVHYLSLSVEPGVQGLVVRIGNSQKSFEPLANELLKMGSQALERRFAEIWSGDSIGPESEALPLYENHSSAAQIAWSGFDHPHILREFTKDGEHGRQVHIELGEQGGLWYLYCANTFDQRQIVVMERASGNLLEEYFMELFQEQMGENSNK